MAKKASYPKMETVSISSSSPTSSPHLRCHSPINSMNTAITTKRISKDFLSILTCLVCVTSVCMGASLPRKANVGSGTSSSTSFPPTESGHGPSSVPFQVISPSSNLHLEVNAMTVGANGPTNPNDVYYAYPSSSNSASSSMVIPAGTLPNFMVGANLCPKECHCDTTSSGKKRVSCMEGAMDSIPTHFMDKGTQVILFSAPEGRDNEVSLGRIFMEFTNLEQVTISHSNLRAIGDSSFWPGKKMSILDLSHNRIKLIRDTDFNGLINLQSLNLSNNILSEPPSAPFRFLVNLTSLSLSNNRINKLVPRLFYKLDKLEYLDLSDNPLNDTTLSGETFKDVKGLKSLRIERTSIKSISPLMYKQLGNLRELHLSENRLSYITSFEFSPLSNSLKHLYLDGNMLSTLRDNSFYGLRLIHLGLSRNFLTSLPPCVFCNLQVESLDLSSNRFSTFSPLLLSPVSHSLVALHVGGNVNLQEADRAITSLVSPLTNLQILRFPSCNATQMPQLPSLPFLSTMDASDNKITFIPSEKLSLLASPSLKSLHLHNNPFDCSSCQLIPLLQSVLPAYNNICPVKSSNTNNRCMVCSNGADGVRGKPLHLVSIDEVAEGDCAHESIRHRDDLSSPSLSEGSEEVVGQVIGAGLNPIMKSTQKKGSSKGFSIWSSEPGMGVIIAILFVSCVIVAAVTSIIIFKCRYEAAYYTRENINKSFSSGSSNMGGLGGGSTSSPSTRGSCSMHHFNPRYPPHVTTHLTANPNKNGWFTLNSSVKSNYSLSSPSCAGCYALSGQNDTGSTGNMLGNRVSAAAFSRKFHSLKKSPFKVSLPSRGKSMSTSSCHSSSPISLGGGGNGDLPMGTSSMTSAAVDDLILMAGRRGIVNSSCLDSPPHLIRNNFRF